MKILLTLAITLAAFTFASAQHEYAPLQEHELKYKDWTYKTVADGKDVNLRSFAANKKLVLVVYFAPWCPNWRNEAPFAEAMYEKYKASGLDVIGVSEYGTLDEVKATVADKKITFPIVSDSISRDDKQKTAHYDYRKTTGDTRGWGSPWNIFVEPSSVEKKGDVLMKKATVVNGELMEAETEAWIRAKLGLPAEMKKTVTAEVKSPEVCDPTAATLKKP